MWSNLNRYSQLLIEAYGRGRLATKDAASVMWTKMVSPDLDFKGHYESVRKTPLPYKALGTLSVVPFIYPVVHDIFTLTSSHFLSGQAVYAGCLLSYMVAFRGNRIMLEDIDNMLKGRNEIEEHHVVGLRERSMYLINLGEKEDANRDLANYNFRKIGVENHNSNKFNESVSFRNVKNDSADKESSCANYTKSKLSNKFYVVSNQSMEDLNIDNNQHKKKDGENNNQVTNNIIESRSVDSETKEKNKTLNQNMGNSYLFDEKNINDNVESAVLEKDLQGTNLNLKMSIVPLMIASIGLPQATTLCSLLLMSGMGGLAYIDMKDTTYSPWVKSMRLLITSVGISCMSLTLMFSFVLPVPH